jgi:tetratricopeptide (TPR) repeat protein/transcriptional regulator with XRE-family HTH domain
MLDVSHWNSAGDAGRRNRRYGQDARGRGMRHQRLAVGQELARLRKEAKLTQRAVAGSLGLSPQRVSQIERGEWADPPNSDVIDTYLETCLGRLGCSADERKHRRSHVLSLFKAVGTLAGTAPRPPAANQLPRDVDTFTGREAELALLRAAVAQARSTARVIAVHTVDGRPGVGKSAFVTHAAHQLTDRFPDAQLFIDLHGHSASQAPVTPVEALATLLKAVGVPGRDLPASAEERTAMWRQRMAGQSALLILDNAADAAQVLPLLPNTPECLVLVTSRRRLADLDPAPVTIPLDVLPADDAERMLRAASRRDLPADSPVGELVALCGHLPLAIHLVAGRLRTRPSLTVADLVDELRDSVGRLASMRVRNHYVAAAFELSYQALSSQRQAFFRALGLHPGPDTDAHAFAALTASSLQEAKRQLEGLFDVNLVDEQVYGRFKLHDLIAEYVRDLVATVDPDALRRSLPRLLDYYQDAAFTADGLLGPRAAVPTSRRYDGPLPDLEVRGDALAWLTDERENLLACLRAAAQEPDRVLALTTAMTRHLRLAGPWDTASGLHEGALQAARVVGDRRAEATALLELACAHRNHGDYQTAARCAEEALTAWTAVDDGPGRVSALVEQASVQWLVGSYDAAQGLLDQALGLSVAAHDQHSEANVLVELGTLAYFCDEYEDAERRLTSALRIFRQLGQEQSCVRVLKNLGNTWYFMDRYDDAEAALGQALTLARDLGDALVEAQALTKLGGVSRLRGHHEKAVRRLAEARPLARRLADRSLEAELLIEYGVALARLGRTDESTQAFDDSLALYADIGENVGRACALKESGDVLVEAGRLDEGRDRLREAMALNEELGERMGTAAVWNSLGRLELAAADTAASARAHRCALAIAGEIHSPLEEAAALLGLGNAARGVGDTASARRDLKGALTIFERIGAQEADDVAALLRELSADGTQA